jgi:hypothetical protein
MGTPLDLLSVVKYVEFINREIIRIDVLQIHYPKSNIYNAAEPTLQFSLLLGHTTRLTKWHIQPIKRYRQS